jgi:hypothetical protein
LKIHKGVKSVIKQLLFLIKLALAICVILLSGCCSSNLAETQQATIISASNTQLQAEASTAQAENKSDIANNKQTIPVLLAQGDSQDSCNKWCHNGWCESHCDKNYMP